MRSTSKGETLAANIARFDALKKMKLSSLLKFTSKVSAKKVSSGYSRVFLYKFNLVG